MSRPIPAEQVDQATEQLHIALDAVPYSIHGRDGGWVDGGAEVIAAALVAAGWVPPGPDRAAADMAHRDDLARDVARLWIEQRDEGGHLPSEEVCDALDRLAAEYRETP